VARLPCGDDVSGLQRRGGVATLTLFVAMPHGVASARSRSCGAVPSSVMNHSRAPWNPYVSPAVRPRPARCEQ
jgi:hypothetical protein